MIKKLLFTTSLTVLFAGISAANAADLNQYVSAKAARIKIQNRVLNGYAQDNIKGVIVHDKINDDVWGGRIAYGLEKSWTDTNSKVRTEIEYGYNHPAKNKGTFNNENDGIGKYDFKATLQTVMLNTYYDYQINDNFAPYIGFGLGYSHIKTEGTVDMTIPLWGNYKYATGAKDSRERFVWNISAGTSVKITDNIAADLGYRYTKYGKINSGGGSGYSKYRFNSHEGYVGVRYTF